jgi:hypothetical protein
MRSDYRLIREIAKRFGLPVATAWQLPPMLALPSELGAELLRYKERVLSGEFTQTVPIEMPWSDVVVDLAGGLSPLDKPDPEVGVISRQAWLRITTLQDVLRPDFRRSCPWLTTGLVDRLVATDSQLLITAWELWPDPPGVPSPAAARMPEIVMGPLLTSVCSNGLFEFLCTAPKCPRCAAHGFHVSDQEDWTDEDTEDFEHMHDPDLAALGLHELRARLDALQARDEALTGKMVHITTRMRSSRALSMALMTMLYLTHCDEYVVSEQPRPQRGDRGASSPKPWTRTDLPRLILIDPGRVAEYGHPSGESRGQGHHASPRPHGRRGHWRHFRAERFSEAKRGQRTWVRPMWVGDREWAAGSQRYSVVWPPNEPEAAERVLLRRIQAG